MFVIAYRMRRGLRGVDKVLAEVKLKRSVRPSENFLIQLNLWGQMEYEVWEEEEKVPNAPYAKVWKEKGLTAVLPQCCPKAWRRSRSAWRKEACRIWRNAYGALIIWPNLRCFFSLQ